MIAPCQKLVNDDDTLTNKRIPMSKFPKIVVFFIFGMTLLCNSLYAKPEGVVSISSKSAAGIVKNIRFSAEPYLGGIKLKSVSVNGSDINITHVFVQEDTINSNNNIDTAKVDSNTIIYGNNPHKIFDSPPNGNNFNAMFTNPVLKFTAINPNFIQPETSNLFKKSLIIPSESITLEQVVQINSVTQFDYTKISDEYVDKLNLNQINSNLLDIIIQRGKIYNIYVVSKSQISKIKLVIKREQTELEKYFLGVSASPAATAFGCLFLLYADVEKNDTSIQTILSKIPTTIISASERASILNRANELFSLLPIRQLLAEPIQKHRWKLYYSLANNDTNYSVNTDDFLSDLTQENILRYPDFAYYDYYVKINELLKIPPITSRTPWFPYASQIDWAKGTPANAKLLSNEEINGIKLSKKFANYAKEFLYGSLRLNINNGIPINKNAILGDLNSLFNLMVTNNNSLVIPDTLRSQGISQTVNIFSQSEQIQLTISSPTTEIPSKSSMHILSSKSPINIYNFLDDSSKNLDVFKNPAKPLIMNNNSPFYISFKNPLSFTTIRIAISPLQPVINLAELKIFAGEKSITEDLQYIMYRRSDGTTYVSQIVKGVNTKETVSNINKVLKCVNSTSFIYLIFRNPIHNASNIQLEGALAKIYNIDFFLDNPISYITGDAKNTLWFNTPDFSQAIPTNNDKKDLTATKLFSIIDQKNILNILTPVLKDQLKSLLSNSFGGLRIDDGIEVKKLNEFSDITLTLPSSLSWFIDIWNLSEEANQVVCNSIPIIIEKTSSDGAMLEINGLEKPPKYAVAEMVWPEQNPSLLLSNQPVPYKIGGYDTPLSYSKNLLETYATFIHGSEDPAKVFDLFSKHRNISELDFIKYINNAIPSINNHYVYEKIEDAKNILNVLLPNNLIPNTSMKYKIQSIAPYFPLAEFPEANSPLSYNKVSGTDSIGLLISCLSMLKQEVQSQYPDYLFVPRMSVGGKINDLLVSYIDFKIKNLETKASRDQFSILLEDLDTFCLPVIELKNIVPGDILVNKFDNEFAIVVEVPIDTTGLSNDEIRSKILVITVNRQSGAAALSSWVNSMNLQTSVIQYPDRFIPMHIVLRKPSFTTPNHDIVSNAIQRIDLSTPPLFFRKDSRFKLSFQDIDGFSHLIPNTNEAIPLNDFACKDQDLIDFTDNVKPLAMVRHMPKVLLEDINLSPIKKGQWIQAKDPNYDETKNQIGNIYNNQTFNPTEFYFISMNSFPKEDGLSIRIQQDRSVMKNGNVVGSALIRFTKSAVPGATLVIDPLYARELSTESPDKLFSITKLMIRAGKIVYFPDLKINNKGKIVNFGKEKRYFAMYAQGKDGIAPIPGDDIAISFSYLWSKYAIPETISNQNITLDIKNSKTTDSNFSSFTVYDKKMLWRANLYVDDGDGAQDWNNLHPWITGNDWNRVFDGTVVHENNILNPARENSYDSLDIGIGDQTIKLFPSWTRYVGGNANGVVFPNTTGAASLFNQANKTGNNSVAYTTSRMDSPFDFVRKLLNQREYSKAKLQAKKLAIDANPNLTAKQKIEEKQNLDNVYSNLTISKNDDWFLYQETDQLSIITNDELNTIQHKNGYYPYRPNYSAIINFERYVKEENGNIPRPSYSSAAKASAGLDCNGLINRVINYRSSPYDLSLSDNDEGSFDPFNESFSRTSWTGASWENGYSNRQYRDQQTKIMEITLTEDQYGKNTMSDQQNLKFWEADIRDKSETRFLIPGDLILMTPKDSPRDKPDYDRPSHIVMVQKVQDINEDGKIQASELTLIESASGNDWTVIPEMGKQNSGNYHRWYQVLNKTLLSSYLHGNYYISTRTRFNFVRMNFNKN